MTIDERIEALTHSVELLAGMHRQTEKEVRRFIKFARLILADHEIRLSLMEDDDEENGKPDHGNGQKG